MHPAFEVDALVKRYGARAVVDGVSFAGHAGRVLALLGRNGAGKTTTVECIEGFRRPDAGRVTVLGADPVAQRHEIADRVGVMLQEGGAYQAASPREMLRLYTRLFSRPRRGEELLELLGLSQVADARFRTLSGGEKQRVNLALALVGSPQVLFLDEPTSGMDTAARHTTWEVIAQLRVAGTAVLLTTHHLEEAERLADDVVVIHQGRVAAAGTLQDLTAGGQQVVVATTGATDAAQLTQILGLPVTAVGAGRFGVDGAAQDIPAMTAALAAAQVPITGIAVQQRTLEHVFLSLTGGPA